MAKYTKNPTWADLVAGGTRIDAADLNALEAGVYDATFGRSTTFPSSPVDGQLHQYPADTTNGVMWLFVYRTATADWEFSGGPPLYAEVATVETTTSTTYAALATAGPSIALPFVGDWMVEIGAHSSVGAAAAGTWMSYDIGGTAAVDADSVNINGGSGYVANTRGNGSRVRRKAGLTAVTLTAKYRVSSSTGGFESRWMRVLPVRHTP